MKKQEFLGFAILHLLYEGREQNEQCKIFNFFVLLKIYGSQSQVQEKLTLNYRLYEKQLGMQVLHKNSALLAGNWPSSLYKN